MALDITQPATTNRLLQADTNIVPVVGRVRREEREHRNRHRGHILWLTGLSGAGKSTLAAQLERDLFDRGFQVMVLDGDNCRHRLNRDLSFSRDDRRENVRRVGEVARLFMETGFITIAALISPYDGDRKAIRSSCNPRDFSEIYLECPLEECERRDPKGMYRKARAGLISNFTGVDDPFEPPTLADLRVDTKHLTVGQAAEQVIAYMKDRQLL